MTIFSTLTGASIGLGLQFYSNAVRKLPLFRQPWLHVAFLTAGAVAGSKYPQWECKLREEVNMIRRERNLPELVKGGSLGLVEELYKKN